MPADEPSEGYLFDLYRRYIGEPEDRTDVYLGFGLFLGGIGLAIVALVLFLWSNTLEPRSAAHVAWAEPAYATAMFSLPLLMLGIVVLLPAERRVLYTSIAGVAITTVAVGGFLFAYPDDWNGYGADYTVEVVAVYAVGLAGITASTGAALIAHYLDMARAVERIDPEDDTADDPTVSDAEIEQDIDEAMEDVELSWGGVEKAEHKRLSFSEDQFDEVTVDTMGTTTTRSTGVDQQVAGLKGLKGGDTKTTTSSTTVDDQTQKLKELREQQQEEKTAAAAERGSKTFFGTLWTRLRTLLGRD